MSGILALSRSAIQQLLPLADCIEAVESAFVAHAHGRTLAAGVLGTHVSNGGFHVKTCGFGRGGRDYYVAKINANFPGNPARGRPTIQGVLTLFDASNGVPLAVMDSAEITRIRTAAASGVAAKHLSPRDADTVAICGCGVQGRVQLEAMVAVRPIRCAFCCDTDARRAATFAAEMATTFGIPVESVGSVAEAARAGAIVVTCTSSKAPILVRGDVCRGAFVAAVGADSEDKQEIEPELMADSIVVVDVLKQCAAIGDLHHAIARGLMTEGDVVGDLSDVVSGRVMPATFDGRTVVFDSTGTALEDVAAAALVYGRALDRGAGAILELS